MGLVLRSWSPEYDPLTLLETLRHSLTWDQGTTTQDWKSVTIDTGIEIHFCDPLALSSVASMRTPTVTASVHSQKYGPERPQRSEADLDRVAAELKDRPRKRFGY